MFKLLFIQAAFLHSYTTKNRDIYQSFHRAEEQMKQVLKARKAEIKVSVVIANVKMRKLLQVLNFIRVPSC